MLSKDFLMPFIAIVSHAFGAIVFFVVALFSALHPNTRLKAPWFIAGCFMMALWGGLSSLYASSLLPSYVTVALADVLRASLWCFCLLQLLKTSKSMSTRWVHKKTFMGLLCLLTAVLLLNALFIKDSWWPGNSGQFAKYSFVGQAVLALFGLYLVEQLFRGAKPERRFGIGLLCLGFGCLFLYDFYMFFHAILFSRLHYTLWEVRGGVSAIVAPLMAITAMRNTRWSEDILPSQKSVFHSLVFLIGGVYILLMTAVAYYVREHGGTYGQAFQVLFLVASLLMLGVLLVSRRLRAWLKLQMSRHLFQYRYDYREEWLHFTRVLSLDDEDRTFGARTIKAFAHLVESQGGALYEVSLGGFQLNDIWSQTDEKIKFPRLLEKKWVETCLVDDKVCEFTDFSKNGDGVLPSVWLTIPLLHGDVLQAVVLLTKPCVDFSINWEVRDLLETCAQQAAVCFVQNKHAEALAVAKQFEGFNRLAAFVVHDIKNVVAQLALVEQNRAKHEENPDFIKSVFRTMGLCTQKMQNLLGQLHVEKVSALDEQIELNALLQKVEALFENKAPALKMVFLQEKVYVKADSDKLQNILCHLIDNALEACEKTDSIVISVSKEGPQAILEIIDTGCGMSEDFIRKSLFQPFVSTKVGQGMGIGVFQAKAYVESLGGKIQVESQLDKGSTFTICLPVNMGKESQAVA